MKLKTVRDADKDIESEVSTFDSLIWRKSDPYVSQNLYIMSELAQELMTIRAQSHSWDLQSYPGKVKLPSDILRALPDSETALRVRRVFSLTYSTYVLLNLL
jgi:hypothetical protein